MTEVFDALHQHLFLEPRPRVAPVDARIKDDQSVFMVRQHASRHAKTAKNNKLTKAKRIEVMLH